jgi:rubrerythrin
MSESIEALETYSELESNLDEGNNLFQCNKCGHYSGDPRPRNFYATCPGCNRVARFYRLIE